MHDFWLRFAAALLVNALLVGGAQFVAGVLTMAWLWSCRHVR